MDIKPPTQTTPPFDAKDIDGLKSWWNLALGECRISQQSDMEFQNIMTAYGEQHRRWHTADHLINMFHLLETLAKDEINSEIIFSIFYHDFIYKPTSKNNELNSAIHAQKALRELKIDHSKIKQIYSLIIGTKLHTAPDNNQTAIFFDLDMAILGSDEKTYNNYIESIAQEYCKIPSFIYRKGRKGFLKNQLKTESIYHTPTFKKEFETQAILNIKNELAENH